MTSNLIILKTGSNGLSVAFGFQDMDSLVLDILFTIIVILTNML